MIKKTFVFILLIIIVLTNAVFAAGGFSHKIDENLKITITGVVDKLNLTVPVVIKNADGKIDALNQIKTGLNGEFNFSYNISAPTVEGKYQVFVSGIKAYEFWYDNLSTILNAFNGANSGDIERLIDRYGYAIGISLSGDYLLIANKDSVKNDMTLQNYVSLTQIKDRFISLIANQFNYESTLAITTVNNATSATIAQVLEDNKNILRIVSNEYFAKIINKSLIYASVLNKQFANVEAFVDVLYKSVAISAINESSITEMDGVIVANNVVLGIDVTEVYNNIKNKYLVHMSLFNKNFTNIQDVRTIFNKTAALSILDESSFENVETNFYRSAGIIGFNINGDFEKLGAADKQTVIASLRDNSYKSVEQAITLFNTKVSTLISNYNNQPAAEATSSSSDSVRRSSVNVSPAIYDKIMKDIEKLMPVTFKDISDAMWAEDAIMYLCEKKIINGKSEVEFAPNDYVTREEFLALLIRAFHITSLNAECSFLDVSKDAWYYNTVAIAQSVNIVNGEGSGKFGIGKQINREDMATMLSRALEKVSFEIEKNKEQLPLFSDESDISEYAKLPVSQLRSGRIINGISKTEFMPKSFATRAMAAQLIYNALRGNSK